MINLSKNNGILIDICNYTSIETLDKNVIHMLHILSQEGSEDHIFQYIDTYFDPQYKYRIKLLFLLIF